MRKYHLFTIKNEYYKSYQKNTKVLYRTLENLFYLKDPNLTYGLSLFDSICQPFATKLLNNYIKNKYEYKMLSEKVLLINSTKENTKLQINPSAVIIESNVNFPESLKVFNIYNKHIFICDFENEDYFWLNNQIQKRKGTFH